MAKIANVLANALIALHQFGVEFSSNVCGSGPDVVAKDGALDFIRSHSLRPLVWGPDTEAIKSWLASTSVGDHRLSPPVGYMAYVSTAEQVGIILRRYIEPTAEDYAFYAAFYGFDSYEEAQYHYGDMAPQADFLAVLVDGDQLEQFLKVSVPYCWR